MYSSLSKLKLFKALISLKTPLQTNCFGGNGGFLPRIAVIKYNKMFSTKVFLLILVNIINSYYLQVLKGTLS